METKVDVIKNRFRKVLYGNPDHFFRGLKTIGRKNDINTRSSDVFIQLFEAGHFVIIYFMGRSEDFGPQSLGDILITGLDEKDIKRIVEVQKELRKRKKCSFGLKLVDTLSPVFSRAPTAHYAANSVFVQRQSGFTFSSDPDYFQIEILERVGKNGKIVPAFFYTQTNKAITRLSTTLDSYNDVDNVIKDIFDELGYNIESFREELDDIVEVFNELKDKIVFASDRFSRSFLTVITESTWTELPRFVISLLEENDKIVQIRDESDSASPAWVNLEFLEKCIRDSKVEAKGPKKQTTWKTIVDSSNTTNMEVIISEEDCYEFIFKDNVVKGPGVLPPPVTIFINEENSKRIKERSELYPMLALKYLIGG